MKDAATDHKTLKRSACQHEWKGIFDAAADAACYNDGFNYRPAEETCVKCGKRRKIQYADETKWYKILLLSPLLLVVMIYLGVIAPILIFILALKDELGDGKQD